MLKENLLGYPAVYNLFQKWGGGDRARAIFVKDYIKPRPGDRVLDIGCGPGDMIRFFEQVEYIGCDPSKEYIHSAQQRHGNKGQFFCADLSVDKIDGQFDIIHLTGILHHLDTQKSFKIIEAAKILLKPEGKLWTLDGCFANGQSLMAKWVLKSDRGKHVRDREGYEGILKSVFNDVESHLLFDLFNPIHHTNLITC